MCWHQTLAWEGPNGPDEIPHFLEKLCAFCLAFPYDGSDSFPETVAHENASGGAADADADIAAAKRLGARGATAAAWEEMKHNESIQDVLGHTSPDWRLFDLGGAAWQEEAKPAIQRILSLCLRIRGIGVANATKLFWVKRPHLIPICDSIVMNRLIGTRGADVCAAMHCIEMMRNIGIKHQPLLHEGSVHLTEHLDDGNPYRRLFEVRILEAVLWFDTDARRRHWALLGWNH